MLRRCGTAARGRLCTGPEAPNLQVPDPPRSRRCDASTISSKFILSLFFRLLAHHIEAKCSHGRRFCCKARLLDALHSQRCYQS